VNEIYDKQPDLSMTLLRRMRLISVWSETADCRGGAGAGGYLAVRKLQHFLNVLGDLAIGSANIRHAPPI
jgi:hypothetical protein